MRSERLKIMKMTDHTCAYNILTNFDYEAFTMTGSVNHVNAETSFENS